MIFRLIIFVCYHKDIEMLGYYQDIKAKGGNKLISGKAELPFEPYVMTY